MRGLKLAAIAAASMATACATPPAPSTQSEAPPQIVWPGLTRFESEAAFKEYLRAVQAESRKQGYASRRGAARCASHAFNSLVDETGAGVMGLPTALDEGDAGRWWWRSESSDVSFLSVTADGALASLGALRTKEEEAQADYECEVSCIDWYGNSRALFVDGRIYALTGVELIEGAIKDGSIEEIRRLNLTGPVGR